MYKQGDIIFAKIKGTSYWPAESNPKQKRKLKKIQSPPLIKKLKQLNIENQDVSENENPNSPTFKNTLVFEMHESRKNIMFSPQKEQILDEKILNNPDIYDSPSNYYNNKEAFHNNYNQQALPVNTTNNNINNQNPQQSSLFNQAYVKGGNLKQRIQELEQQQAQYQQQIYQNNLSVQESPSFGNSPVKDNNNSSNITNNSFQILKAVSAMNSLEPKLQKPHLQHESQQYQQKLMESSCQSSFSSHCMEKENQSPLNFQKINNNNNMINNKQYSSSTSNNNQKENLIIQQSQKSIQNNKIIMPQNLSLQISNKLVDDMAYRLQNRIIPIIEDRIQHNYYDDKEVWVCEIVEIIRSFKEKNFQGEHIFDKDYGMLFEQIYDGLLTLSKKNKKDYKFVQNLLMGVMKDIDKKILEYYHDYTRISGGFKLQYNRQTMKKLDTQKVQLIKIEEDCSIVNTTAGNYNEENNQSSILNDSVVQNKKHSSPLKRRLNFETLNVKDEYNSLIPSKKHFQNHKQ